MPKIGLPSRKCSLKPSSKGKGTTLPLEAVALEMCEERYGRDPDIDAQKADLNIYEGIRSGRAAIAYIQNHMAEISTARGRKLREDTCSACTSIVKPSMETMLPLNRDQQLTLLRDGVAEEQVVIGRHILAASGRDAASITKAEALAKGREVTVTVAYHFDEGNPHAHLLWEPIIQRKGKAPTYSAKEVHDKVFMGDLNRSVPAALRERGWDIDDSYDHTTADEEAREERRLLKSAGEIQPGLSAIRYKDRQIADKTDCLASLSKEVESKQAELDELADIANQPAPEVEKGRLGGYKTESVEALIMDNKAQRAAADAAQREAAGLRRENSDLKKKVSDLEERVEELTPYQEQMDSIMQQAAGLPKEPTERDYYSFWDNILCIFEDHFAVHWERIVNRAMNIKKWSPIHNRRQDVTQKHDRYDYKEK